MFVHIKKGYSIFKKRNIPLDQLENLEKFDFNFPATRTSQKIVITIFPQDRKIESQSQFEVSDLLFNSFKIASFNDLDSKSCDDLFKELSIVQDELTKPTKKIIQFIKLFFNRDDIEQLFPEPDILWSMDAREWKKMNAIRPSQRPFILKTVIPLNDYSLPELQKCIDSRVEPFLAFDYLFQADKLDEDFRHKWINATIALELAIKEYLISKDNRLITIFYDIPAPPLTKMYYSILKEYDSEIEPVIKKREIEVATRIRNKLVHNPGEIIIDEQDINAYIKIVKATIFQMFSKKYPDIDLFSKLSDGNGAQLPCKKLEDMLKSSKKHSIEISLMKSK